MTKGKLIQKSDKKHIVIFVLFISLTIILSGCLNPEANLKKPVDSSITQEDAIRIVVNDPVVIRWIDNNSYEVQDVHLEVSNITRKEGTIVQKFWIVPLVYEKNGSTYHWNLVVTMNGSVMYNRYPTVIPPQPT